MNEDTSYEILAEKYGVQLEKDPIKNMKDIFMRTVSYELVTPLHLIHGYGELLNEGSFGELGAEQQKAVDVIVSGTQKLRNLVEQITTLLSVEAKTASYQPILLTEVATAVILKKQAMAAEAEVRLTLVQTKDMPLIFGDLQQLIQAVDGLVDNSIKFTPPGGEVKISVYGSKETAYISVTDTGKGIPQTSQNDIFNIFYQVDSFESRQFGGMGLGLSVTKAVVEAHSGNIRFHSQLGKGTEFTLRFPTYDAPDITTPSPHITGETRHILIVDDEENVIFVLVQGLSSLSNCEIVTASNGDEALQAFAEKSFDLLITDYRMPGTNGINLAQRVRELYPETIIIMITAYANNDLEQKAEAAQIKHILSKPVKLTEIRNVTLSALDKST